MIRISIDSHIPSSITLRIAAEILRSGGIVAYPTESSYGLGAYFLDEKACRRIYRIKGRNREIPLPLLIPDPTWLDRWAETVSVAADKLIKAFWPGALTLVARARVHVPKHLVSGEGKVGLRLSGHPVASGLVRAVGAPITATSANRSGRPGIVLGAEIGEVFGSGIDMVLDGGRTSGNPPSTVVDIGGDPPLVLRTGALPKDRILEELYRS